MEARRRRELLLAGCVVILASAAYMAYAGVWPLGTSDTASPASNKEGPRGSQGSQGKTAKNDRSAPAGDEVPNVHLNALDERRPRPDEAGRNLFRFKAKPPPPAPPAPPPPKVRSAAEIAAATGPAPPPPITLKFIGIVDGGQSKKVAILSDGRGTPLLGREGETILGQYRILRIGTESIEMAYLDGRGRQTIRLTGS